MPLQTGNADVSQFDDDELEPTVEKATLDAHITKVNIKISSKFGQKSKNRIIVPKDRRDLKTDIFRGIKSIIDWDSMGQRSA